MTYTEGDLVWSSWGTALVCRAISGGTYILAWHGVGKEEESPRLHHEIANAEQIRGLYTVPEELEAMRILIKGRRSA